MATILPDSYRVFSRRGLCSIIGNFNRSKLKQLFNRTVKKKLKIGSRVMYFCKKKTEHIFWFHASDRLHDQRKKREKKPEVKADPKVQELQQRLEARKAGRLKPLFDNSDGKNDNKLRTLSGKAAIQDIYQC